MGDKTGISWCDATWNPIRGCSRVSEGCRHCYAERVAMRFSGEGQPYNGLVRLGVGGDRLGWSGVVRLIPEHLADPLRWKKPRRIFVNSMSDLFHEKLTNEQIAAVFGVMAAAPQHTFQVLTKRAKRMREWFEWIGGGEPEVDLVRLHAQDVIGILEPALGRNAATWPLPNVWLGVSVENQEAHDERAEDLLACPAAVYFFSVEPMLGPVDASQSLRRMLRTNDGRLLRNDHPDARSTGGTWRRPIDWLIAGCESGPGARPCSVDWLRGLRDQCEAAGVSYFLKQAENAVGFGAGSKRKAGGVIELPYLDGVQHAAFPEVRHG